MPADGYSTPMLHEVGQKWLRDPPPTTRDDLALTHSMNGES